jgi:pSer/pThr/pTyr-binding forkhead associated (FHA) protein
MAINMIVLDGKHRGQKIALPQTHFFIGRDGSCHLRPVSTDVSKFHCAIAHMSDRIVVRDLKSTNGTVLNGERITGTAKARDGDVLEIGPLKFMFQVVRETSPRAGGDSHLDWLMRSPNELENRVLDPHQDTSIIELDQLPAAGPSETSAAATARPRVYSEEATVVAGRFLRDYMATRKKPAKK